MLLHCKDCLFRRQLSGQSGFVEYDMVCRKTGAEYRARQVHRTSVLSCHVFEKLRAEYEVLGSISHEFIQKFIGSKIDANSYVHFVESESVNLLEFYRDDFPLTEKVARDVCAYLLTAVSFLHQNDIVHLNIRPDRVFVGPAGEFKLGGFFYAKFANELDVVVGSYGTPNFQAPEVFESQSFDGRKADVWACGVFLLSILTGRLPFECPAEGTDEQKRVALKQMITERGIEIPEYLSAGVRDLLARMLAPHGKRESVKTLLQHEWLKGASDTGILPEPFNKKR